MLEFLKTPLRFNRTTAHVIVAAIGWPLLTVAGTVVALVDLPYYSVSLQQALAAALTGVAMSLGDMLLAGLVFFGISLLLFTRLGRNEGAGRWAPIRLTIEPLLMLVSVLAGASLWYPAVVSLPLLSPLGALPAAVVVALLAGAVALGAGVTGRPGRRLQLLTALLAAGVASGVPAWVRTAVETRSGAPPTAIVLGIDSLSHGDDLGPFRVWANAAGGTWYERAVSPGLLTNAVWTSVLTMEPVRAHGVFHTFQPFPGKGAALLDAARAQGYRTVSFFPDQLTCAVGSQAGFDQDRSGPVGWRQILLPAVANSSVLMPLLRPALPRQWPTPYASNQAGTFTYDVRRDVRAILRAGDPDEDTLVAAHLTYAHLPAYPRSADLSWSELGRVALAPARAIRDRSFDWQDVDLPTDPVPLRAWKLDHLRRVIGSELRQSRYLEQGGRLVLFSDHGDRAGLTMENFTEARYHHVLLATFGVPPRCQGQPVSIIDIGSLLGFSTARAEPAVEFAIAPPALWPQLVVTARLRWSGAVDLDEGLLARISQDLRGHVPWPGVKEAGSPADKPCSPLSTIPQ